MPFDQRTIVLPQSTNFERPLFWADITQRERGYSGGFTVSRIKDKEKLLFQGISSQQTAAGIEHEVNLFIEYALLFNFSRPYSLYPNIYYRAIKNTEVWYILALFVYSLKTLLHLMPVANVN